MASSLALPLTCDPVLARPRNDAPRNIPIPHAPAPGLPWPRSRYAPPLHPNDSEESFVCLPHPLEVPRLGLPAPCRYVPTSRPLRLTPVDRFNAYNEANFVELVDVPPSATVPHSRGPARDATLHLGGRTGLLTGAGVLSHAIVNASPPWVVAVGGLTAAGGLGASLTALRASHADLQEVYGRRAYLLDALHILGALTLAGGAALQQLGQAHKNAALMQAAIACLALGSAETAGSGGLAYAAGERQRGRIVLDRRAGAALATLDVGTVGGTLVGLAATQLSLAPLPHRIALGVTYAAAAYGAIWQYADACWQAQRRAERGAQVMRSWLPALGTGAGLGARVGLYVGALLIMEGSVQRALALTATGAAISTASAALIVGLQLGDHYPALRQQQPRRALAQIAGQLGSAALVAGAGALRGWAQPRGDARLVATALGILGAGMAGSTALSAMQLSARLGARACAPPRRSLMAGMLAQMLGLAVGVGFGLDLPFRRLDPRVHEALLALSYVALGWGSCLGHAAAILNPAHSLDMAPSIALGALHETE